jgi:hypothetical protein
MPPTIIVPSFEPTREVSWPDLRRGIARVVKAVTPKARVYPHWPMKYNIGQTINLLRSKYDIDPATNEKRIHSWMVSVATADPEGEGTEELIGGYNFEWLLKLRVWGFIGYMAGADDDGGTTHDLLENEARLVSTALWLNRNHLGLDRLSSTFEVGKLKFEDIDVHGFGTGVDCHVAQGFMEIRISEEFVLTP